MWTLLKEFLAFSRQEKKWWLIPLIILLLLLGVILVFTASSGISWAHWPEKAVRSSRQGKNGRTLVVCLDPAAASPGACSMLNISVSPNAASVCFLWQVVEMTSIPQKYFLSAQACSGILVRAARRGKKLPALLNLVLTQQTDMQD